MKRGGKTTKKKKQRKTKKKGEKTTAPFLRWCCLPPPPPSRGVAVLLCSCGIECHHPKGEGTHRHQNKREGKPPSRKKKRTDEKIRRLFQTPKNPQTRARRCAQCPEHAEDKITAVQTRTAKNKPGQKKTCGQRRGKTSSGWTPCRFSAQRPQQNRSATSRGKTPSGGSARRPRQ